MMSEKLEHRYTNNFDTHPRTKYVSLDDNNSKSQNIRKINLVFNKTC